MAPILKEAEASVATATTSTPAAPHAKSPTEAPTRPQPMPLEIPVSVNGARTVNGSDKREPFSETSHTVLVFPLGAVIRLTTPLVPGQLVFLTNEKSKKEVVCQVVKSKSGGTTSGYVELQFTEPAPGFWGLQFPGSSSSPAGPRVLAPSAPKTVPAAPPLAAKPVTPVPSFLAPAKPVMAPPPPPPVKAEPAAPQSVVPAKVAPSISVPPPPPVAAILQARPGQHNEPAETIAPEPGALPPASATPAIAPAPSVPALPISVPPLRDYSKEINSLFAPPSTPISSTPPPAVTEPKPASPSSSPTSEELKLQAVRLQAQLSSMLFTGTPAPPASTVPPVKPAIEPPVPEAAKKVFDTVHDQPEPNFKAEPAPLLPARKPVPAPLAVDEEVRIPSWLAPLSQNSPSSIVEPAASSEVASDPASSDSASLEEPGDSPVVDGTTRSHAGVFGGQLLGESSAPEEADVSSGSKKGLFLALAAAALLLMGGAAWYYQKNYSPSNKVSVARPAAAPPSAASEPVSNLQASRRDSTPALNTVNPSSVATAATPSKSSKNTEPVPTKAVFNPAPEPKKPEPVASRNAPPVEPPKKPALGDVHLAAPVVSHSAESQQSGEPMPSIQTNSSPVGTDLLGDEGGLRRKAPVAPRPVGGDVKPAQLLKSVAPIYPQVARAQRISGNVQIDALVDTSGNVATVKVISGPPVLHNAALEAVKQWKYSPALLDGQPTSMHLTVTVQFRTQ